MSSKCVIESMIKDVKCHHRDKKSLMEMYVTMRLNKLIDTYYKLLLSSSETLSHLSEKRVVKHLNK